ncbi:MAG: dipicolinate synthase [Oscillospiraceae bacterium]|jgi:dipicolinate synthase subunit A|nr:dipicolinate synthase [Oscillospiraceae bacterium]
MKQKKIVAVLGGDARQAYAARTLLLLGFGVRQHHVPRVEGVETGEVTESIKEAITGAQIVLGPTPWREIDVAETGDALEDGQTLAGGWVPKELRARCGAKNVTVHDLLLREDFNTLGTIATAEGAIAQAITHSAGSLHGSHALVLGYGRCAKPLAKKLQGLGAHVAVTARRWEAACTAIADGCEVLDDSLLGCHLPRFAYIFNTVPAPVLGEARLRRTQPEVTIIDIATAPGGVDFAAAKTLARNARLCPGLPGQYAPRSAGEHIAQTVRIILEEQEGSPWGWNHCVPGLE